MTEVLHTGELDAGKPDRPELHLVPNGPSELELQLSRALAAGSDWIVDYRGLAPGESPRRYLKPEALARYARPALRAVE